MLGYLSVDEKLIRKCFENGYCFWATTGLVQPFEDSAVYGFDCFFHKYLLNELLGDRILLSFRLPFSSLQEIAFSHPHGLRIFLDDSKICNKAEIESYLNDLKKAYIVKIRELGEKRKAEGGRKGFFKKLVFFGARSSESDLEYFRSVTQYRFVSELTSLIGFKNDVLDAEVRKSYVLYHYEPESSLVSALVGSHEIKLPNHSKLLNLERLLKDLGSR
ncbi:MAG: hypothetical protein QXV51_00065 [Thermosphaera sp.]